MLLLARVAGAEMGKRSLLALRTEFALPNSYHISSPFGACYAGCVMMARFNLASNFKNKQRFVSVIYGVWEIIGEDVGEKER